MKVRFKFSYFSKVRYIFISSFIVYIIVPLLLIMKHQVFAIGFFVCLFCITDQNYLKMKCSSNFEEAIVSVCGSLLPSTVCLQHCSLQKTILQFIKCISKTVLLQSKGWIYNLCNKNTKMQILAIKKLKDKISWDSEDIQIVIRSWSEF